MKATIYYEIKQAGGRTDRFDTKESAMRAWNKLVDFFNREFSRRENPDSGFDEDGWIPSLRHSVRTDENGYELSGEFCFSFDCEENGRDVTKRMTHTLKTYVVA